MSNLQQNISTMNFYYLTNVDIQFVLKNFKCNCEIIFVISSVRIKILLNNIIQENNEELEWMKTYSISSWDKSKKRLFANVRIKIDRIHRSIGRLTVSSFMMMRREKKIDGKWNHSRSPMLARSSINWLKIKRCRTIQRRNKKIKNEYWL